MIGFLKGQVHSKYSDNIILLVSGVGYQVYLSQNNLASLNIPSEQSLFIHSHIREDAFELYGFKTYPELEFFKLLISVSGVGAKTGLLIMNRDVELIQNAIINADVEFFSRIPRLGKKTSQKIIIDLKNKVGGLKELDLSGVPSDAGQISDALIGMGYTRSEALQAIKSLPQDVIKVEEKIRLALRFLGKP